MWGTVLGSNSLGWHRCRNILGISPLRERIPLSRDSSATVEMTVHGDGRDDSPWREVLIIRAKQNWCTNGWHCFKPLSRKRQIFDLGPVPDRERFRGEPSTETG